MSRKRYKKKPIKKLLSIVIPVHGRFDLLDACIDSIFNSETSFDYDLTLIDNNSPEQEEAREFYKSLPDYISTKRNRDNFFKFII